MKDVYIMSAARTAIGAFGGSLKDMSPTRLGAAAARAAIERSGLAAAHVDHSIFGTVIPTESADLFLGRTIGIHAGLAQQSMGLTVNRLCGSGAQAIITAASMIQLGDAKIALAGGAEAMSRSPYAVEGARFGRRMGNGLLYDWLANTFADPFGHGHMGCTAENLADIYNISRERQDIYALESQRRAARAQQEGRFDEQIVPVELETRKGAEFFARDEHLRADTSLEGLARLTPAFREGGTVTAGNASGINDGAAALLLVSDSVLKDHRVTPVGRIVSWGLAGVPPEIMGIGPVMAVPIALERAGLKLTDIDVIESNEAFAAQAIAVADCLGFDPEIVNPNGGAVALGHPLGATGAILTTKALYELLRTGGRYGLVTMCIGGGQGIALIIENLS
ncbi:beta-ketothiolase BktB [Sphingopyxis sp. CCNWLW253]|uniref:beta-ketothiolase BktB n=1 Tax=unclassified Sphingopyxis TaxID=2614943 RepID=UPI0030131BDE